MQEDLAEGGTCDVGGVAGALAHHGGVDDLRQRGAHLHVAQVQQHDRRHVSAPLHGACVLYRHSVAAHAMLSNLEAACLRAASAVPMATAHAQADEQLPDAVEETGCRDVMHACGAGGGLPYLAAKRQQRIAQHVQLAGAHDGNGQPRADVRAPHIAQLHRNCRHLRMHLFSVMSQRTEQRQVWCR
jgi:hypothetical protein